MATKNQKISVPQEFFAVSTRAGLGALATTIAFFSLALASTVSTSGVLQIICSSILGLSLLSVMVIAHECGHGTLLRSRWANASIGIIAGTIAGIPYLPMKYLHRSHHQHLNHRQLDPTWRPWTSTEYQAQSLFARALYRAVRGPLWWLGSVFNLILFHFNPKKMPNDKRTACTLNMILNVTTLTVLATAIVVYSSWFALIPYLIIPFFVFNAAYSSLTLLQHTLPSGGKVPVWHAGTNEISKQDLTVHLRVHPIVARLFHNINWHVPHHIHAGIPFHKLPAAHHWLVQENINIIERDFTANLLLKTAIQCQLISEPATDDKSSDLKNKGIFVSIQEGVR